MGTTVLASLEDPNAWFIKVIDHIDQHKIGFGYSPRQHLLGFINSRFDQETAKTLICKGLKHSEMFDIGNLANYLTTQFNVNDYKIYHILRENDIDVNDFGIKFEFKRAIKEEIIPDLVIVPNASIIDATLTSNTLVTRYADYKVNFILDPLIFENGNNILGAERGTGKTRLAINIGFAITYGWNNYLNFPINKHGAVLFLNFEMHEPQFKLFIEPIENFFKSKGQEKHVFRSISFKSHTHLKTKDIEDSIARFKPLLVIIDGYKAFSSKLLGELGVRELNNNNMNLLYDILDKWRRKYNCTNLITNHTNKGTKGQKSHSDLMFGASAFTDYADHTTLLRKTNEPNQRLIIPDKARFSKEGATGANIISIQTNEDNSMLWFELTEADVNEADYMYSESSTRYTQEVKERAKLLKDEGKTLEDIAHIILGDKKLKGTISKWLQKFPNP
jgi:hypothetical protein